MKVPETARPVQFQDLQFIRADLGVLAASALTLVSPFVQQGGGGTGPTETHLPQDNEGLGPSVLENCLSTGEGRDLCCSTFGLPSRTEPGTFSRRGGGSASGQRGGGGEDLGGLWAGLWAEEGGAGAECLGEDGVWAGVCARGCAEGGARPG